MKLKIFFMMLLVVLFMSCADSGSDGDDGENTTSDTESGYSSLIVTTDEPEGENCGSGGTKIETGIDDGEGDGIADDSILHADEVDNVEYICNGDAGNDGDDGTDGDDGEDSSSDTSSDQSEDTTSDTVSRKDLTGSALDGPCLANASIIAKPLDDNFDQKPEHYISETKNDFGDYDLPVQITEDFAEIFGDFSCHNEVTGQLMSQKRLSAIIDLTAGESNNVTPMTTIRSPISRDLFDNGFGTQRECLVEAERLILIYMNMPNYDIRFTDMNLVDQDLSDAVLVAVNSTFLMRGRNEAEQLAMMAHVVEDIINGTELYRDDFLQDMADLQIITIKNHLETRYELLGHDLEVPKIWNVIPGVPDYYSDLLERDQVVQGSFNLEDTGNCSFDQSTYNTFAIPHVFESWIETSNYIVFNFSGDISIWTKGIDVNDKPTPETKVLDIEPLREKLLDSNLAYHGKLGDHNLTAGTEYYIMITSEDNFTLTTGCDGGLLPFDGRKLASQNNGETWIGQTNNTSWFRKSGVIATGIN